MGESPGPAPCRGCGAALDAGARFCARCGRSRDVAETTLIELRPVGPDTSAQQTAVVTTRPPDRKRTLTLLGAVVVVGLLAVGLVKTFGNDNPDEATSPTTTGSSTTTSPTSTTVPPTTAPATTAPRTTTTLAPATTTTIPYVNQRRGVLLDEAQSGRSIYFASGLEVFRIELGSGRVSSRRFTGGNGLGVYGVVDGRLVLGGANGLPLSWVAADLSGDLNDIALGQFALNGSGWVGGDGIWTMGYGTRPGATSVARRIDLSGKVRTEVTLPANMYPAGFLGDRVVIAQFGRIWTVGADGRATPYATGDVVAVQGGFVLWVACDDNLRCTFHLGDATNPDTGRTSLETSYLQAWPAGGEGATQPGALAPDGATIVASVAVLNGQGDGRPKIVDLPTGSVLELSGPGYSPLAWTPDGDWLVESTLGGEFVATNVRTGRKVTLAYPAAFLTRSSFYALAVG